MSGLRREQFGHRWKYPSVDELIDACERVDQVADQLGRLIQAYVIGGEEIHVHIRFVANREPHGVCVSFVGFRYPRVDSSSLEDWLPTTAYELDGGSMREQIQAPVLVPVAHDLKHGQGMAHEIRHWPSIERLQCLERCLGAARGALELPADLAVGVGVPPLVDVLPTYAA